MCARTIHSYNSLAHPPHVGHQPGHCCGMASHSSTSICRKSARVVVIFTLAWTTCPSWSHNCSVGLRSGLLAGHSILSTPKFWRQYLRQPHSVGVRVVNLEDRVQSQTVEIWDLHWYLSTLRLPPMMTSLEMPLHTITLPTGKYVTLLVQQSA